MNIFRRLTLSRWSGWKLAALFGFSMLLVFCLLLTRAHIANAASGPTITSDTQDYQPGATVTLTGTGWTSGEDVHIFVNDSVGNTWSLNSNPDPAADANGGFTYSFSLPDSFIASYTVTATGQTSGTATTTFTDSSNCPSSPSASSVDQNPDNNVSASFTTSGSTATYKLGTANLNPSGGIPGLIEYCVYTSPQPASVTASYDSWTATNGTPFSFSRPGGDPTNVPFDGNTYTIGTATWSGSVPASQSFVFHVNDPVFCQAYNGSSTCFVLPGTLQQQASDLTVSKTATPAFTRTFTWGITKSVDQTKVIDSSGKATFNYTVSVTHDNGTDSAWQVSGTITVTNPNGFDFTGVDVTDKIDNNGNCSVTNGTGLTVPANNSVQVPYTCTYSSAPGPSSGTNTATATWDGTKYNTPDSSATGSATFDFSKVTPTLVDDSVTVTDTLGGNLGTVSSTDPSPKTFTYSYTVTGTGGTCVNQDNTASFITNISGTTGSDSKTVTLCTPVDLQVTKDATPSFVRTYTWAIKKNVDQTSQTIAAGGKATFNYTVEVTHDSGTDSDWKVTGTITVSNPNDFEGVDLTGVTDSIDNGGSCTITSGDPTATVPKSGKVTLGYTCTYASAPSPSAGTNTATATWDQTTASTPSGTASGTANVDFSTTTPTVVDGKVTVVDDKTDPSNPVTLGTADYTQANPIDFTYALQLSGVGGTCTSYTNTATFTTNTSGTTGSSSQRVTVCAALDLKVAKDATPSFTRTYSWKIAKSVDKTFLDPGGTATYTVTVTQTGFTDSAWQVTGSITITNPNDFESITLTGVTDAVDNGGSCTVSGNTTATITAGASVTLTYTCTYSSAPTASSGTNTATASWDKTAATTPDGSAQGTKTFAFTTPTTRVNQTITVTDTIAGTLGTATAADSTPFTTQTFTYTHKFTPPASGCVTVNNTATIKETGQTASQSVKNCNSGALTMGFWQNKNGQSIISAANQGTLGTWLRQYHPFSDAPSTGLATYVTNIIKAANCSGTTCNTMLRAQMLATALDVYFSDPALGGNKINAPAPIGGLTIDLTNICHMADGSGGTATCSGTNENVSSAFGGATSLTIQAMLTYQNTADPAPDAGANWYNQNKATQVLAKDAFDAINNQVASVP